MRIMLDSNDWETDQRLPKQTFGESFNPRLRNWLRTTQDWFLILLLTMVDVLRLHRRSVDLGCFECQNQSGDITEELISNYLFSIAPTTYGIQTWLSVLVENWVWAISFHGREPIVSFILPGHLMAWFWRSNIPEAILAHNRRHRRFGGV